MILDKIFLNCATFLYRLNSPQLKWYLVSSTKNIVYKLPHELSNDLMKTLGNQKYQEELKFRWSHSLMPSFGSRNKTLIKKIKIYEKADIKVFLFCPILLDFFLTFFQIFCPGLQLLVILVIDIFVLFFNIGARINVPIKHETTRKIVYNQCYKNVSTS